MPRGRFLAKQALQAMRLLRVEQPAASRCCVLNRTCLETRSKPRLALERGLHPVAFVVHPIPC